MKTGTVKELLDHYNGHAPGYDALRLVLATIIFLTHAILISASQRGGAGIIAIVKYLVDDNHFLVRSAVQCLLPMFFALGGFLVTGSAYRVRKLGTFLLFRVLRILPALLVEVTLSAIFLGALITTLPLRQYYTDPAFYSYFLNILGIVHFQLPGVFTESVGGIVNANLATLPPDFHSYAIMSVLLITGLLFNRWIFLGLFTIFSAAILTFPASMDAQVNLPFGSTMLIYAFFSGVLLYTFADRIHVSKSLALVSIASLLLLGAKYVSLLGMLGVAYLTLYIGFTDLRNFPLVRKGDYSYGIYLYGFPIAQATRHYLPSLDQWWQLALVSFPITLSFAMLSWHYIENPFLSLKKKLPGSLLPDKKV